MLWNDFAIRTFWMKMYLEITNVIFEKIFSVFLKILCFCRLYWLCIEMLIEEVATALRMDEAKLDNIEDPSFDLTSFFKESESYF